MHGVGEEDEVCGGGDLVFSVIGYRLSVKGYRLKVNGERLTVIG